MVYIFSVEIPVIIIGACTYVFIKLKLVAAIVGLIKFKGFLIYSQS